MKNSELKPFDITVDSDTALCLSVSECFLSDSKTTTKVSDKISIEIIDHLAKKPKPIYAFVNPDQAYVFAAKLIEMADDIVRRQLKGSQIRKQSDFCNHVILAELSNGEFAIDTSVDGVTQRVILSKENLVSLSGISRVLSEP